jgi:hypothetical protein
LSSLRVQPLGCPGATATGDTLKRELRTGKERQAEA